MEPLSKTEVSYMEKCLAMVTMHNTRECACHKLVYANIKGLLCHLRSLRIWFPVYTCYNCMITYTDRSTFSRHLFNCTRSPLERLITLSKSGKRSNVKTRLYQNFKCTSCLFMYSFHDEYCNHVDEAHCQPPFTCSCKREFADVEEFKKHVYVSCLVEYYCDICFVTVKTLDDFQKHAEETHDASAGFIMRQDDDYHQRKPPRERVQRSPRKSPKKPPALTPTKEPVTSKRKSTLKPPALTPTKEPVTSKRKTSLKPPTLEAEDDEPRKKRKISNPPRNPINPGQCPLCIHSYSTYHGMVRHYKTIHVDKEQIISNVKKGIPINADSKADKSMYSCLDCSGMYTSAEWKIHLEQKHEPKKCLECGKMFQFQIELEQHRTTHLNLKICRDSKTQSYKSSMLSPTGNPNNRCDLCPGVFSSSEELVQHRAEHDNMPQLELVNDETLKDAKDSKNMCIKCNKSYAQYSGLNKHINRFHPELKPSYPRQCQYCNEMCKSGKAYNAHKRMHENGTFVQQKQSKVKQKPGRKLENDFNENIESPNRACKICLKIFSNKYNLKKHMKTHGTISDAQISKGKKVWCDICHTSCESVEALAQHKENDHLFEDMPDLRNDQESHKKLPLSAIFTCDKCVSTFTSKTALKKHKEKHINELNKSVYCKHCKIRFESDGQLNIHMHDEHNESLKKNQKLKQETSNGQGFTCSVCKKKFTTALALQSHTGWHKRTTSPSNKLAKHVTLNQKQNRVKSPEIIPPEHQCSTCLAVLPNDTALQIHILEKHRKIDALMLVPRCNICNQDFETQDDYETHRRLHDLLERQKLAHQQGNQQETAHQFVQPQVISQVPQQPLAQPQKNKQQNPKILKAQMPKLKLQNNEPQKPQMPKLQVQKPQTSKPQTQKLQTAKQMPKLQLQKPQMSKLQMQKPQTQTTNKNTTQDVPKIVTSFRCSYCPAAFTREDSFITHMKQNHKEFATSDYKCTVCNRVFEKQHSLSIHLKVHAKEQALANAAIATAAAKTFSCSICNMNFDLPKDLRTHTINAHPF